MKYKKTAAFIALVIVITGFLKLYSNQENIVELYEFPKGSNYAKEWSKVDSLINKGLNKSALAVVEAIYARAKADKNAPQYVKAIIHRMKMQSQMEEFSLEKSINELTDELKTAKYPIKPVLHSIIAESYWLYYQNNRWKFNNRTQTVNFAKEDIATWDLKAIVDQCIQNYNLSLQSEDSLKRTRINLYDDILITGTADSRIFRPTLYDFLAHRAVDFYMNTEPGITKPAFAFELNSEEHFKPSSDFVKLSLSSPDTMSLKLYAAQILQNLIRFHSEDKNPEALVNVDLKRLLFVRKNSVLPIKDSLYLSALEAAQKKYSENAASTEIAYYIADYFNAKGDKYKPLQSDQYKWDKKKAIEICDKAIQDYPNSYGAQQCVSLKGLINVKNMSFTTEKVNVSDAPFRSLLTYKNVNKLYVRVAKMDYDNYNRYENRYSSEELMKRYVKLTPVKEFTLDLPDDKDYQTHNTEISIPALPVGYYVILVGSDKNFTYLNEAIAYSSCWVSNISYINRKQPNGSYDFYTTHRSTGQALKGVSAQLLYEKYNYTTRKYDYIRSQKYTSNEEGYFNVPATTSDDYRNFNVEFTIGNDELVTDNNLYQYRYYKESKQKNTHTFFYTDRAIYRPGQTVYFKGIMISTDGETNDILPNTSSTVTFYDVNSQKIASMDLVTNEYGTFNGTFTAPNGVLTGQMYITDGHGSQYISVEEYKRPKFEVKMNPVKGSFKLNDELMVTGFAKSYAGAAIDGASVKYRVVRNASFPYWCYWWWGYNPTSPEMEITNGVIASNDTGGFAVKFKAIPDLSIHKKYSPTYNYSVYVDVTDINGETHSTKSSVSVGYTALSLDIALPEQLNKNDDAKYKISTTNLMGEFEPAKGKIEIFKLKQPEKVYRERLWEQPDKHIFTQEEWSKLFPLDLYSDENSQFKWARGEKVKESNFDTEKQKEFMWDGLNKLQEGVYVMEAHCKDKYGEDVKDVKYITVFSEKGNTVPVAETDWYVPLKTTCEPGEKATFLIGSASTDVRVLYEIEHKGVILKKEFINLSANQKLFEIPVEEKYRGNFVYHLVFIKNNRTFSRQQVVTVPYTNKQLDIEFATFRNKLLPGETEEWKLKIKDKKGEKIAAEMMATLYDASLDAFKVNSWYLNIYNSYYAQLSWTTSMGFGIVNSQLYNHYWNSYSSGPYRSFDALNWFGYYFYGNYYGYYDDYEGDGLSVRSSRSGVMKSAMADESVAERSKKSNDKGGESEAKEESMNEQAPAPESTAVGGVAKNSPGKKGKESGADLSAVAARKNLQETAFFYPTLQTNEDGEVIIKFTVPEALTKWKMLGLAHTKDLKYGITTNELVTQKQLMVTPNLPRFFRENDKIILTAKVDNLSEADMSGTAQLFLYDATTMKEISSTLLGKNPAVTTFNAVKSKSAALSWELNIPEGLGAITCKIVAGAGKYTDGEENAIPVLTNSMLVTESMPLPIRGGQTKTFAFEKFINQNNHSTTLRNHKLTLEFTANPAWYAVQSLPYLMEYPYECAEQTFSRFYANSIASHIANSSPKIKAVFDSWRVQSPDALLSNLEKNQELKSLMLEETPWVLDAKDESQRKKRVALLFDLNKMSNELERAMKKLQKMQAPNGGWPWFEGMPDDRYITQHIVTGMGHLDKLGIKNVRQDAKVWDMVRDGAKYLDERIREDYEWILKYDMAHLNEDHIGYSQIQYLYARSYFKDIPISNRNQKAFDYYKGQAKKYWLQKGRYMQGMIALALNRYDDKITPKDILKSLKENSLNSDEMGMYWKENYEGFYWYEAPIEAQALLIEAFDEVGNDKKAVDDLKVWLLKSKQTQDWKTTKATAEACYALLLRGTDWLATESNVEISLGTMKIDPKKMPEVKQEAGTGYFKTSWSGSDIKPEMGNVTVVKKDEGVSWGALYWQYFEQLDKITPHKTPLSLKKKLFIEKNTSSGPVIEPISDNTMLKVGDKIKVRIELRVDRDMEYVQMKDMRASGFEPINVISSYKWQDGLGYYESTKDAATNFFFSYLRKGTYVFEYPLRVTHKGNFSNGITTIQCMYAPEFTSHSEGVRVKVEK